MPNEHPARVALGIAYTTSIAAYPNFSSEIYYPMSVAFLLPITATARHLERDAADVRGRIPRPASPATVVTIRKY